MAGPQVGAGAGGLLLLAPRGVGGAGVDEACALARLGEVVERGVAGRGVSWGSTERKEERGGRGGEGGALPCCGELDLDLEVAVV